ncbi:roadblock/LC7 domain-containing protein [Streptomyces sp. NPDC059118]|uniref:roadblock/LC7 domain-containing protein n=1 Tax=unclassified Streptomyces TaxID=2593676 RepID=UPI0036B8F94A
MHDPASPHDLQWLLDTFIKEVPGVTHCLLATPDGIKITQVNLSDDGADLTAAAVAGLNSLSSALGGALGVMHLPGGLKQVLVEDDRFSFYLMRVGQGLPEGHAMIGTDPLTVVTCLAVVAEPGADIGDIAYNASRLNASLAQYLRTPVRNTDAAVPGR